jgi:hypothetical protein
MPSTALPEASRRRTHDRAWGERHQPPQSPYAHFANSRDLGMKPLLERVLALREILEAYNLFAAV